jgi:hypothetical protein
VRPTGRAPAVLWYSRGVSFDWMTPRGNPGGAADHRDRLAMYRDELAQRAALFYRLGYARERAVARLRANVAWDFELPAGTRPAGLSDSDIAGIVDATYQRRPAR